jgi:hypothetical protein
MMNDIPTNQEIEAQPQFLSMPDPCEHVTRLEVIAARLNDYEKLEELLDHIEGCRARKAEAASEAAWDNRP